MPFAVDTAAAEAWMLCMDTALEEQVADEELRALLHDFFQQVAMFMRNRA